MASSSSRGKDRRSSAASAQSKSGARRGPRSSIPSSPERDANPPARRALSRSSSDTTAKLGKAPSTAIPGPKKSRLPTKKASPEKPASVSRQPPAAASSVKDKATRPSATVARAAPSAKPASATKIIKPGGAAAQSSARVRNPGGDVARKKETGEAAAAPPPRAREEQVYAEEREAKEFESASVISTEDHYEMFEDKAEEVAVEQVDDTVEEKVEEAAEINDAIGEGGEVAEEHEPASPKLELDVDGDHSDKKTDAEGANEETDGEPSPSSSTEEADKTPVEAPPEKVEPEPVLEEKSPVATEAATPEKAEEEGAGEHKAPSADRPEKREEEPGECCKEKERPAVLVFKKPASATTPPEKKETPHISNDVLEETRSKLLQRKKSKVGALVGAFETVISLQDDGQT